MQPPFRILDATGHEVGGGLVDGDPVEVPPGRYRLEVLSGQTAIIDDVVVEAGARVEVPWGDR